MPAVITHYLFALRVFNKLKKAGIDLPDRDMALIGAQGPDIFFFHRVLPWKTGDCHAEVGSRLHRMSPARLFEGMRGVLNTEEQNYNAMLSYIEGFFCHYALDRAAHPYIYWAQQKLADHQPTYGKKPVQYHLRIESALDTIMLRRETGRLIDGFNLTAALPKGGKDGYDTIGRLYASLLFNLFGMRVSAELLSHAPGDMRQALFFMNDRTMLRQKLVFRPIERLTGRGHFATCLLRPTKTDDWDYAGEHCGEWFNPYDGLHKSNDSFFDLYEFAVNEAYDMITAFISALPGGKSMQEITQDRGFSSDLPGIYDEK